MKARKTVFVPIAAGLMLTAIGCDENTRLAEMAERHLDRQAEQNRQMVELQRQVADGSRELVAADAKAREELMALQRDVQTERTETGRQRDELEKERRSLAAERRMDPIIAAAISNVGLVLACLLPLVLCWRLLRAPDDAADRLITEVLIENLVAEHPLLAPTSLLPRAIGYAPNAANPRSTDPPDDAQSPMS
ncbi:MAG: hypothetical protein NTY19_50155 [Planctomycetota bacterium]|nr:hypothetical protein [Planctomycetota bacterium]